MARAQDLEDRFNEATKKGDKADKPPVKLPKSLAACADLYNELRAKRLAAQKATDELEAAEKFVKDHLINSIPKSDAAGVTGKTCRILIVKKQVPQVKDWDSFYKFILKTKDFSLLNRAANKKAIEERWEAKKVVPGVEAFETVTLSLSQIK